MERQGLRAFADLLCGVSGGDGNEKGPLSAAAGWNGGTANGHGEILRLAALAQDDTSRRATGRRRDPRACTAEGGGGTGQGPVRAQSAYTFRAAAAAAWQRIAPARIAGRRNLKSGMDSAPIVRCGARSPRPPIIPSARGKETPIAECRPGPRAASVEPRAGGWVLRTRAVLA